MLRYHDALASGRRSREYARFLGIRADRIAEGYNAVPLARIRALAASPLAPEGIPFEQRHFTVVARFVPRKNLSVLIDAHARFCQVAGPAATRARIFLISL